MAADAPQGAKVPGAGGHVPAHRTARGRTPCSGPCALTLGARLWLAGDMARDSSTRTAQSAQAAAATTVFPSSTVPGSVWLVGVDSSDCACHAAQWALANGEGRANEVRLLTAWNLATFSEMSPHDPIVIAEGYDAVEKAARVAVDDLSSLLSRSTRVPITTAVEQGGAAAVLLDAAPATSLLVVGSRGRGGFAALALGSTSTQCATHSPVPVAVIPESASLDRVRTIGIAFDGSPNAVAALSWTVEFADPDSIIECISVWDAAPIAVGADRFFFPEASDLARERFEHLVATTLVGHRRHDVEVRTQFMEGRPRHELAEGAATVDLLVMGARGHGAIGAHLLGSVSTWLLHHAHSAMVVVPHPPRRSGLDNSGS
jgi:nucleotide-binding universal stress UspA family protein